MQAPERDGLVLVIVVGSSRLSAARLVLELVEQTALVVVARVVFLVASFEVLPVSSHAAHSLPALFASLVVLVGVLLEAILELAHLLAVALVLVASLACCLWAVLVVPREIALERLVVVLRERAPLADLEMHREVVVVPSLVAHLVSSLVIPHESDLVGTLETRLSQVPLLRLVVLPVLALVVLRGARLVACQEVEVSQLLSEVWELAA